MVICIFCSFKGGRNNTINLFFVRFHFSEANVQVAEDLWCGFSRDWGWDGGDINWYKIVASNIVERVLVWMTRNCKSLSAFQLALSLYHWLFKYHQREGTPVIPENFLPIYFEIIVIVTSFPVWVYPRALPRVAWICCGVIHVLIDHCEWRVDQMRIEVLLK